MVGSWMFVSEELVDTSDSEPETVSEFSVRIDWETRDGLSFRTGFKCRIWTGGGGGSFTMLPSADDGKGDMRENEQRAKQSLSKLNK